MSLCNAFSSVAKVRREKKKEREQENNENSTASLRLSSPLENGLGSACTLFSHSIILPTVSNAKPRSTSEMERSSP